MATSFLVSDLLADIARSANVPAFSTTTSVTLAQATYWLVQAARSLSARYRDVFGSDGDYLRTASLTVQADVGLTSMPDDCGEIHAVLWAKSSSDWRLLDAGSLDDLQDGHDGNLRPWTAGAEPRYRLEGETLTFYPISSIAENVVVLYTTHLDLTDETSFLARVDSDLWLTWEVVRRVLVSQNRDTSAAVAEKVALEASLFGAGRKRDVNEVHTIRNTRGGRVNRARDRWPA